MDIVISQILTGLGVAVLHSLWQGALAALTVFIIRAMTKDSQASLRCALETAVLGACFIAFIFTFVMTMGSGAAGTITAASIMEPVTTIFAGTAAGSVDQVAAITPPAAGQYAPLLGVLWCIGFAFLSAKYSMALYMTNQLRKRGLSEVPSDWSRRFRTLVLNAGIFKSVVLHISDRVNGPVTLGFFRPVVLVPAGFFTGLPPDQIEAILLHEIAHIRRHDYLINLVQSAIKAILFYHPGIHYICKCIDDDREQACDDFAVRYTQNPKALVKGLAALRLNPAFGNFALAANDHKKPLLRRLTRLTAPEESRRRPEQVVTSLAALVVAAGLYIGLNPVTADAHPGNDETEIHVNADKRNYHFATTRFDGRDITIKKAGDGSRWVYTGDTWHNIDKNPDILRSLPQTPKAPVMPRPEAFKSYSKFKKAANQYKVNLDYYVASLENASGNADKDALHMAKKQKRRVSEPSPDYDVDYLAGAPKPVAWPEPAELPEAPKLPQISKLAGANLTSGLYIDGQKFKGTDLSEDKIEALAEKFEDEMDEIEELFEDALDDFEAATESFSENPQGEKYAFQKAQMKFAEAVSSASVKRELLQSNFDTDIEQMVEKETRKALEKARIQAEKQAKKHAAEYDPKHETYGRAMLEQLQEDGLINQGDQTAKVLFKDGLVFVNGKKIPHKMEDHYCKINAAHNIKKSEHMKVEISPKNLTITDYNY